MKKIKIITTNLRSKPAALIMAVALFAMLMLTIAITSGCCVGPDCGPGWGPPYGPPPGHEWHGDRG